jgi:glutathione synthase/RimK-type ligase-like ATP-grasp enzyme
MTARPRARIAVFHEPPTNDPPWAIRFTDYLRRHGADVVPIAALDLAGLATLREVDGFMWSFNHLRFERDLAKAFLAALESTLGIVVWPNAATRWHYDDKVAQAWMLELLGTPRPVSHVFVDRDDAREWARTATYPQVFKLSGGAGSSAVCLVESAAAASRLIDRAFLRGLTAHHDLDSIARDLRDPIARRLSAIPANVAKELVHTLRYDAAHLFEPRVASSRPPFQRAVIFQEFIAGNDHDTRVTVIGHRAFAFQRFNRPGDFRASGSGRFDLDPAKVDPEALRIAHRLSDTLGFQSMAYDFVKGVDGRPRLLELSYMFVGSAVQQCPGYWDRDLVWHDGHVWPQDAIAEDFLAEVRGRGRHRGGAADEAPA